MAPSTHHRLDGLAAVMSDDGKERAGRVSIGPAGTAARRPAPDAGAGAHSLATAAHPSGARMNDQLARGLPPIDDEYQGPSWWHLSRLADARHNRGMRRIAAARAGRPRGLHGHRDPERHLGLERHPHPARDRPRGAGHDLPAVHPEPARRGLAGADLGAGARVRREPRRAPWWAAWSPRVALLFALAGALEMLIFWGSMVTLNISPELRRWRDLAPLRPGLPHRAHHRLAGRAHLEHRARPRPAGGLRDLEGLGVRRHPAGAAGGGPAPALRRAAGCARGSTGSSRPRPATR